MWKLDNQNGAWLEFQPSWIIDRSRVKLAAAVLAVGLSTSVQASDLLKQCDFNKNWAIDTPQMYGLKTRPEYRAADPKIKEIVSREQDCKIAYDTMILKRDLANLEKELAEIQKRIQAWEQRLEENRRRLIEQIELMKKSFT